MVQRAPGDDSKQKWLHVMKSVGAKRKAVRESWPLEALKPAALGMCVCIPSTSEVEHQFTKLERVISSQQECMSDGYEEALTLLICDCNNLTEADQELLAAEARTCWRDLGFGLSRVSGSLHRPSNLCRPRESKMTPDDSTQMSEAQFQTQQESERCIVADTADMTLTEVVRDIQHAALSAAAWTIEHRNEEEFAKSKLKKRRIQAVREGLLDDASLVAAANKQDTDIARDLEEQKQE